MDEHWIFRHSGVRISEEGPYLNVHSRAHRPPVTSGPFHLIFCGLSFHVAASLGFTLPSADAQTSHLSWSLIPELSELQLSLAGFPLRLRPKVRVYSQYPAVSVLQLITLPDWPNRSRMRSHTRKYKNKAYTSNTTLSPD